ncbi:MAG: hypothetical protein R2735_05365 [Microthrixaceae bacterium]
MSVSVDEYGMPICICDQSGGQTLDGVRRALIKLGSGDLRNCCDDGKQDRRNRNACRPGLIWAGRLAMST